MARFKLFLLFLSFSTKLLSDVCSSELLFPPPSPRMLFRSFENIFERFRLNFLELFGWSERVGDSEVASLVGGEAGTFSIINNNDQNNEFLIFNTILSLR